MNASHTESLGTAEKERRERNRKRAAEQFSTAQNELPDLHNYAYRQGNREAWFKINDATRLLREARESLGL